jgi:2',3'-cyclic-nucleotide 2'-phosphodiesterase (5'-nucleotidase family)
LPKRSILSKVLLIGLTCLGTLKAQEIHILYSQNTNGVLLNCQCPSAPLGGMEKRATFVSNWLKKHPNTLLFDSGDFLSFDGDEINDSKMLRAMDAMNYSAVNIGDQEFSNSIEFIESNMNLSSIPFVTSNLESSDASRMDIPQQRILTVSGLNILVMGVIDSESYEFYSRVYGDFNLIVTDPIQAVRRIYTKAKSNSRIDLVILLSNLGYDLDEQIATDLDFIDVIIGGHSQHQFDRPIVIEKTIITQSGKNGQYLGHLDLQMEKSKLAAHSGELIPMDLSISDDEAMLKLLAK